MISNAIDLSSGTCGAKDSVTESRIAGSRQEQEPGSHISYSAYATSSQAEPVSEQDATLLSDSLPEGALSQLFSPAHTQIPANQPDQRPPGQFMQPNEYGTSLNRADVETTNRFQPLDTTRHPVSSPLVTLNTLQGEASVARTTSSHDAPPVSHLQTLASKTGEISLSLNLSQTSALPLSGLPGGKQEFPSQFSANISGSNNTNLHLPLAMTEPRLSDANEASVQALAGTHRTQAPVSQWGPVPVTPTAPQAHQAQEMLSPLREQIRFQIDQQIKQAELRLDPPELGKVELNIRLDGDRLHIQMHAANASVRDSLMLGLERLRAELAMDHGGQIDVDINQGQQQHRESSHEPATISLAHSHESDTHSTNHESQQSNQVDLLA